MKTALVGCVLFAFAGLSGCGGPESVDAPTSQEVGALAKRQVLDFVESARKNAKAAPQSLTLLMESLDAYVAEYGEELAPLKNAAMELKSSYDSKAPEAEVEAKLQKLAETAESLGSAAS